MKTRMIGIFLLPLSMIFLYGCSSVDMVDIYTFSPAAPVVREPVAESVAIMPVVDGRDPMEISAIDVGPNPLILIPLWPYATSRVNAYSPQSYFDGEWTDNLSSLFARDLARSGLFKNIITPDRLNSKLTVPDNAWKLELFIRKSEWTRHDTTYCLSYPGAFLWLFGLPVSYGNVTLTIETKLTSPAPDKQSSSLVITETISCTEFIYDQAEYLPKKAEIRLAEIFPEITTDLRKFILSIVKK